MKAIILAAGRSTRLYPLTLNKPKSLLEVGGKTLLEYQLDALGRCGVSEVIIVTGYLKNLIEKKIDEIRALYPFEFRFVENPLYAETNNLYSVRMAGKHVAGSDFLCLHADVLFHPEILRSAAAAPGDLVLIADREIHEETMKVKLEGERVTGVGKHVGMREASGTFLGIAKLSARGGRLFFEEVERLVESGQTNAYFTLAFEALIEKKQPVTAHFTNQLPWIEIDFPEELAQAEEKIFPLLAENF